MGVSGVVVFGCARVSHELHGHFRIAQCRFILRFKSWRMQLTALRFLLIRFGHGAAAIIAAMQRAAHATTEASPRPDRTWAERLFGRWWRRQSAAHQDRYATLGPLASVLLFLAAIVSGVLVSAQRGARARAGGGAPRHRGRAAAAPPHADRQPRAARAHRARPRRRARSTATRSSSRPSGFTRERPETTNLIWVGPTRASRSPRTRARAFRPRPASAASRRRRRCRSRTRAASPRSRVPARPRAAPDRRTRSPFKRQLRQLPVFQVVIPLIERGHFDGALIAEYSIERPAALLRADRRSRAATRSRCSTQDQSLASTVHDRARHDARSGRRSSSSCRVAPAENGLVLRGEGYRTSVGLISNTLFWMVMALSVLTVWMLLGTWRHMRRRLQMQAALVSETNFRRGDGELDADRHARHGHGRPASATSTRRSAR